MSDRILRVGDVLRYEAFYRQVDYIVRAVNQERRGSYVIEIVDTRATTPDLAVMWYKGAKVTVPAGSFIITHAQFISDLSCDTARVKHPLESLRQLLDKHVVTEQE